MSRKQKKAGGNLRTDDQDTIIGKDEMSQEEHTDLQPSEGAAQDENHGDDLSGSPATEQIEQEDLGGDSFVDGAAPAGEVDGEDGDLLMADSDLPGFEIGGDGDGTGSVEVTEQVQDQEQDQELVLPEEGAGLEGSDPEAPGEGEGELLGLGEPVDWGDEIPMEYLLHDDDYDVLAEDEVLEFDGEVELISEDEIIDLDELDDDGLILMEIDEDSEPMGPGFAPPVSVSAADVAATVFNGAPLVEPDADGGGLMATAADRRLELEPGTVFADRYRIEEQVLVTRQEVRYRTHDQNQGQPVQLRLILPGVLSPGAFDSAASVLELLEENPHRNLIQIRALEKAGGIPYLVTDQPEGQTLHQFMENRRNGSGTRTLSVRAACNMMTHVCTALAAAHAVTVHGRISMDSILVNSQGRIMVDGLAVERLLLGPAEPPFVAPEQGFDTTGDVYALGVILGVLLGPNDGTLTLDRIPKEFVRVIGRACALDPADRYGDAATLRDAILDALESVQQRRAAAVEQGGSGKVQARPYPGARLRPMPLAPGEKVPPLRPGALGKRLRHRAVGPDEPRWLVSKDGFDYGPFSLNEVTARVKGEELDTATVVQDMTTGVRKKILEFPEFERPLARLLIEREAIQAQNEALRQGKVEQARKMGLGTLLLLVIGGVAIAGLLAWRFYSAPTPKPLVFSDAVLSLGSPVKAPALPDMESEIRRIRREMSRTADRRTGVSRGAGAGGDQIPSEEVTWGDDSAFRSTALDFSGGPGGGSSGSPLMDKGLTQDVVNRVMSQRMGNMQGCFQTELVKNKSLRRAELSFWVRGSGEAGGVKVKGAVSQSLAKCLEAEVVKLVFPSFAGTAVQITYPFAAE